LNTQDVQLGALTQLWGGTSPEGKDLNGKVRGLGSLLLELSKLLNVVSKYLIPFARVGAPIADTQDPQTGKELWTWLEEQVKDL
jgi:retinol dehydrogenase-12